MSSNSAQAGAPHRDRRMLRPKACFERLGCGRTKFYEIIAAGTLPVSKLGRATLIAEDDLAKFMNALPAGGPAATLRESDAQ